MRRTHPHAMLAMLPLLSLKNGLLRIELPSSPCVCSWLVGGRGVAVVASVDTRFVPLQMHFPLCDSLNSMHCHPPDSCLLLAKVAGKE